MRIAGATARAEEQAHHAGELDVAHAHPAWIGERGEQQEAAGAAPAISRSGSPRGSSASPSASAATAPSAVSAFGMMRCSRSISAAGTTIRISASSSAIALPSCVRARRRAQRGGQRLDERIARGDRRRAAAAAPAQQQEREDRNVVVGLDRRAARRAVRGRGRAATRGAEGGRRRRSRTSRRSPRALLRMLPPCVTDRPP